MAIKVKVYYKLIQAFETHSFPFEFKCPGKGPTIHISITEIKEYIVLMH